MKYIEAYLEDGSLIHNLELKNDIAIIENSNGDELTLPLTTVVTTRLFNRVKPETLQDLIALSKQKKIYLAVCDAEPDAIFNEFPEENFMSILKEESFNLDDIENLQYATWGLLKGNEKEVSLKEIAKILEDNSNVEEDEY